MATTGQRKKAGVKPIIEQAELADVTETTRNGETTQTIKYKAPIEKDDTEANNETENQDADFDNEDGNFSFQVTDLEIPKDKIDIFFDKIQDALTNESDNFFIRVLRMPDNFDDNFYHSCRDITSFGLFGCRLTERYKITDLLQKKNNNSGGRFNLIALDSNQQPLQQYLGTVREYGRQVPQTAPIVARDVFISNPVREEIKDATSNGLESVLLKLLESQRESNQQILNAIRENGNGKTTAEFVQEIVALKQLFPEPKQNDFMQQMLTMPIMMETFAANWREAMKKPEPVAPVDKTLFSQVVEAINTPAGQDIIDTVKGVADVVLTAKFAPQNLQQQQQQNPQPEQMQENPQELNGQTNEEMEKIINELVIELESENAIDASNETINRLKRDYGNQFKMVTFMCKNAPFSEALNMLMTQAVNIQPFPFAPFIDGEKTQASGQFVYTERGIKAINRLEQVYNFLRESA